MTFVACCADGEPTTPDDAPWVAVEDLCADPTSLAEVVPDDASHLIVGIHSEVADVSRLQAAARRLGFDPLGVGVLDISRYGDADDRAIAIAGLSARSAAFPGATPEQVKLEAPPKISRRALLSRPAPLVVGAPAVDPTVCAAGNGCRACALACPVDALTWRGGVIAYDKQTCVTCGICVTTCPVGAVANPTVTPTAVEAQVRAIVAASQSPVTIRYVCRTASPEPAPGFDVEVACTGMLTPGWLLAPLLLGASAVTVLPCTEGGCRLGNDDRLMAAALDAMTILEAFSLAGASPGALSIRVDPVEPGAEPLYGPHIDAATIRRLAEITEPVDVPRGSVTLAATHVGMIHIDPEVCTACRMCAQVCPTGALTSDTVDEGVVIEFDPGVCTACTMCTAICPEIEHSAIGLGLEFDLEEWETGRRPIREDTAPRCIRCGKQIAPTAMLERITSVLGDEHAETLKLLTTLCLTCRGR